jgi:hypothetical protein
MTKEEDCLAKCPYWSVRLWKIKLRACLDWRIFAGISQFAVPLERKCLRAFGTKEIRFPFQRKGNESCAFQRKKSIHSDPKKSLLLAHHGCSFPFLPPLSHRRNEISEKSTWRAWTNSKEGDRFAATVRRKNAGIRGSLKQGANREKRSFSATTPWMKGKLHQMDKIDERSNWYSLWRCWIHAGFDAKPQPASKLEGCSYLVLHLCGEDEERQRTAKISTGRRERIRTLSSN